MKYLIRRSSHSRDILQPHKDAKMGLLSGDDYRPFKHWTIEINTLEELNKFVIENDDCIIRKAYGADFMEIEIYDD